MSVNKPPKKILLDWLRQLPTFHKTYLVTGYLWAQSQYFGPLLAADEEKWRLFKHKVEKADFPIREIANLSTIVETIDLFVVNREVLDKAGFAQVFQTATSTVDDGKVVPIFKKQWQETARQWAALKTEELSKRKIVQYFSRVSQETDQNPPA